jgi:hypothetical protein
LIEVVFGCVFAAIKGLLQVNYSQLENKKDVPILLFT